MQKPKANPFASDDSDYEQDCVELEVKQKIEERFHH